LWKAAKPPEPDVSISSLLTVVNIRLLTATLASGAAFLTPVLANFDVYMVEVTDNVFHSSSQWWQVFEAQPRDCNEVLNNRLWFSSGDVSGDKEDVRCVGSGRDYKAPTDNIDVMEMNFSNEGPVYHWTLYNDQGRTMVGCK
jgi:hypothetical protein